MSARIEAERLRWTKIVAVLTVPHERIDDKDVRICVAYAVNWISSRRCSELEFSQLGAIQNMSVVRAAAAVIDAERIRDRDIATRGSADARLSRYKLVI